MCESTRFRSGPWRPWRDASRERSPMSNGGGRSLLARCSGARRRRDRRTHAGIARPSCRVRYGAECPRRSHRDVSGVREGRRLAGEQSTFAVVEVGVGSDRILVQVQLDPGSDVSVAQSALASQAQDFIIEHLGEAWPRCPEHAHPLRPQMHGSRNAKGVWICPSDPTVTIDFGDLAASQ